MISISPYLRQVSESRYLSNARSCLSDWRSKFDFFMYMSMSSSGRMETIKCEVLVTLCACF